MLTNNTTMFCLIPRPRELPINPVVPNFQKVKPCFNFSIYATACVSELPNSSSISEVPSRHQHSWTLKEVGQKLQGPGIEPGTYCVLGSRHNQLDHPCFCPGS